MAEVPKKLGKYHILERIAQGGMAEVYKAKSIGIAGFEKILAIKRIKPSFAKEERFIRNFVDEARIAVSLNHRNIVQVFDFGKDEGELFLAMELLEGVNLQEANAKAQKLGEKIPAHLSCYILADIAAGLDYAHKKCDSEGVPLGIVHCDVSPHNILLSSEGFVKILDFGVARARFVAAPKSKRLRGKPRYMAPEQTFGDSPTPASDVFVVGILAWELFSGRRLFDGDDILGILKSVRATAVENLALLRPDLPDFLCTAVMSALQRHPKRRCSASEFASQLSRSARQLCDESGARSLAQWLREVFPSEDEDTETTLTTARTGLPSPDITETTKGVRFTSVSVSGSSEISPVLEIAEEEITEVGSVFQPPAVSTLIDKRSVVVSLLLLQGGTRDRRRELSLALGDLAYKRGAVVHDRSESEVVAIFGLEMAGEDDIASAMHFAIDAAELASDAADPGDSANRIELRSAARAGVVAQRHGSEYRLRGDSLREARELAKGAESDMPLLSGGSGRSASAQFLFRELPSKKLRSRKLSVLELIGPQSHDNRTRALRDRHGLFVGRNDSLRTIWEQYRDTMNLAEQRGILVSGNTGTGKSRLISEFVAELEKSAPQPVLFTMVATERSLDTPFTVVMNYLEVALSLPPNRGRRARSMLSRRLTRNLRNSGLSSERVAESCHTIELAMELRDGAINSTSDQAAAGLRERCIEALRHCHAAFTGGRASVLIIENIHLADAASLDILRSVLNTDAGTLPCLLVMSCRDHSLLPQLPNTVELKLRDLNEDDRVSLIIDRLGDQCTDTLVAEVARSTGGNPLYIEELCRNILDIGSGVVPATVRDSVVARIDRLTPQNRAVLQRAAVIGESFRAPILEELAGAPVAEHLQALVNEGLLQRRDHAANGGEFAFRHGLIRDVVYDSLSTGARQTTHAEIGQLLSLREQAGSDEAPAFIARHLEFGGRLPQAATYWTNAGLAALRAFETTTAINAFDRALAINANQKDSQRDQSGKQYQAALFGRAEALRDVGNYEEQGRDLAKLESLCQKDSRARARLLTLMADRHLRNGAFEMAIETAKRAIDAAQHSNTPVFEGDAQRIVGEARERTGDFQTGLLSTTRAIAIFETLGATAKETRARISLARSFLMQAEYEKALRIYQPILAELESTRDPKLERIANNHLAAIYLCLGHFEDAMQYAQKGVRLCEVDGDLARLGDNISLCGIILSSVGQYNKAREFFGRAEEHLRSTKSRWSLADCLVYQASNHASLGEFTSALDICSEAFASATEFESPYIRCNAKLTESDIYLGRNQPSDSLLAEEAAGKAVEIATTCGLPGSQAIALSRLAQAVAGSDVQRALQLSDQAIRILLKLKQIEGAEEELFFQHYLLLERSCAPEANSFLTRSLAEVERKLRRIENQDWRRSYSQDVPTNAAIFSASVDLTTTEDL